MDSINTTAFRNSRNRHAGLSAVLLLTGPTLRRFDPGDPRWAGAVRVGVNDTALKPNLGLDYLFLQDVGYDNPVGYAHMPEPYDLFRPRIQKYYGKIGAGQPNPVGGYEAAGALPYSVGEMGQARFTSEIETEPLGDAFSVAFSAAQFILYTGVSRVFLVGADITDPHRFTGPNTWNPYTHHSLAEQWKTFAKWSANNYPGVKWVSVNPVGLAGLFEEVMT